MKRMLLAGVAALGLCASAHAATLMSYKAYGLITVTDYGNPYEDPYPVVTTTTFYGYAELRAVQVDPNNPDLFACGWYGDCGVSNVGGSYADHYGLFSFDVSFDGAPGEVPPLNTKVLATGSMGGFPIQWIPTRYDGVFDHMVISSWTIDDDDIYSAGGFSVSGPVPEPATWALMIGGFAMAGGMMRRGRIGQRTVSFG